MYYHVWFATKKRKWLLQGDVENYVRQVLKDISVERGISLLEHETVVDHVHLLLDVGPKENLSKVMNQLKGASARKVFLRFPELKLDAGTQHLWQKRYGARVVEPEELTQVSSYIRTQKERLEGFDR